MWVQVPSDAPTTRAEFERQNPRLLSGSVPVQVRLLAPFERVRILHRDAAVISIAVTTSLGAVYALESVVRAIRVDAASRFPLLVQPRSPQVWKCGPWGQTVSKTVAGNGRGFDSLHFRHPHVAQLGRGPSPRRLVVSVRGRPCGPPLDGAVDLYGSGARCKRVVSARRVRFLPAPPMRA